MIGVFTDKEVTLNFGLDIEGNKSLPEASMVLVMDSGLSVKIKAKISEKTAKVTIPPLKHLLKNTETKLINSYLEVIADGAYFVPWKDQCELKESINVQVNEDVEVNQRTESISIKAVAPMEEETPVEKEEKEKPEEKDIKDSEFKEDTPFKTSSFKKSLVEKWHTYKGLKSTNNAKVYDVGYYEGLDSIIKELKPVSENISIKHVSVKLQSMMKNTVPLKEKAEASNKQYDKEYYAGFYSAIVEMFLAI